MEDFSIRQAKIKSVLTCGICKKLCKEVSIIDECCHRFCKKCITKKFTEERSKVCPECNTDLGVAPWQKIKTDHQVQGIRDILAARRKEFIELGLVKDKSIKDEPKKLAHEDIDINTSADMLIDDPQMPPPPPAVATSSRRKEKSSVVSTSTGKRGRRRRRRRGSSQKNADDEDESSKFENVVDLNKEYVQPESPIIDPLISGKAVVDDDQDNKQQVGSSIVYGAESSKKEDKSMEPLDGMNDLWEPLNKLVTKAITLDCSNKSTSSKDPIDPKSITPILIDVDDDDNEHGVDNDKEDEEYVPSSAPTPSGKGKKGRRGRKKKQTHDVPGGAGDDGGGSKIDVAQVQAPTTKAEAGTSSGARVVSTERVHPIWFTLIASDKQDCPSPLPQIPTRYIKIKDPNTPSSYIKKYLVQKLNLQSEDEVEVRILGMPIRPALPMQHLADLWSRSTPNSEKTVRVGASAQEFVMVLKYGRTQIKSSA